MPGSRKQRILLVSANKVTTPYPVFPLGIAFLEAALEKAGHEVRIWDQLIHPDKALEEHLRWSEVIAVSLRNVDNVSSRAPKSFIDGYTELLGQIRALTDNPMVAGGSAFSIFPEELMEALDLQWGLTGEAEKSIVLWLEFLRGIRPLETVPGLYFRSGTGGIGHTPPTTLSAEEIPPIKPSPDWIRAYLERGGMMNAQTQRGCALHCTYCTYPWIEGRCYRHREPADLVAELTHLKEAGTRYVFLTDSVFNTSTAHVEAFCRAIIQSGLDIDWGCFARPRNLKGDLLDLMIESGLKHLEFGSDSFCDATLQSYGKSFRFKDILEASEIASSRRVNTCHYIIFGGPGETKTTIRETVANSRLLPDAPIFAFSGMRIYPHTPLHTVSQSENSRRDLLQPAYFVIDDLPDIERERIIEDSTRGLANWFLNDHSDDHDALTRRFRARGKQGPLWEYLAISRRMNQQKDPQFKSE